MSLAEFASQIESRKTADSPITPPLGGTAINGFNGSGANHSLFPGQFPNYARLNGYDTLVLRTEANTHFMVADQRGQLNIKRQTSADIINALEGRLEIERMFRERGEAVRDRRFALFVDEPDDNFIDDVSFLGFEQISGSEGRAETSAVFLHGELPEDLQLSMEMQEISSIPLRKIVAVLPAYPKTQQERPNV